MDDVVEKPINAKIICEYLDKAAALFKNPESYKTI